MGVFRYVSLLPYTIRFGGPTTYAPSPNPELRNRVSSNIFVFWILSSPRNWSQGRCRFSSSLIASGRRESGVVNTGRRTTWDAWYPGVRWYTRMRRMYGIMLWRCWDFDKCRVSWTWWIYVTSVMAFNIVNVHGVYLGYLSHIRTGMLVSYPWIITWSSSLLSRNKQESLPAYWFSMELTHTHWHLWHNCSHETYQSVLLVVCYVTNILFIINKATEHSYNFSK